MAETYSFLQLVAGLPTGGFGGMPSPEFGVPRRPPVFVPPTLRIEEQSPDATLTLISARGATGKSTLAEQLAATKAVPLWRLNADMAVSGHAVEAKLRGYLATDHPVERFVTDTDAFIIVDALDEARMRVSGVSWSDFLDSIAQFKESGQKFVLLGRERVLEDAWLHFTEGGHATNWYEISHFAADQRVEYIDARVRARGGTADGAVYVSAQSAVLDALAGTVDEDIAEAFVGYAPVLDAVVALLAEGNPLNVSNTFAGQMQSEGRITVLLKILDDLLLREQGKTTATVAEIGIDPALAFRPSEQLEWLAAELMGAAEPPLKWCEPRVKPDYVARVRQFLVVHPFRDEGSWASPVFSAFAASARFADPKIRGALQAVGDQTGLLFDFVSRHADLELIDEWQFAALHSSLIAAESTSVEAVVTINGDFDESAPQSASGELTLIENSASPRQASFELVLDSIGKLELFGPTAFLSVSFPGEVKVSARAGSLVLGPDCHIRSRELVLLAGSVEVQRRAHGLDDFSLSVPSVVLESTAFRCDSTLTVLPPSGALELRVPASVTLRYPWYDYRVDLQDSADSTPDDRAVRFLNMLMNLLRRHGHAGRHAVYDKKLEGRQAIKQADFAAAVGVLAGLGVVSQEGSLIFLQPEWEQHRFSGKPRQGIPTLDDKREAWSPALDAISRAIAG